MKTLLLAFLLTSASFAATVENSNSTSVETKTKREDIDQEITNPRLRAATGAKAVLSLQTAFTYNGSSVDHPFSSERPKLTAGTVNNDPAKLTGTISAKYRVTDHDNINVGIGLGWLKPGYDGQMMQMENPYLSYGRLFKWNDVQNVTNVSITKYTADYSVRNGLAYESDIDHTFLISIKKLQLGLTFAWYHEFYNFKGGTQDKFGMYPYVEYPISDKVSARTVFRASTIYNKTQAPNTYYYDDPSQSLGVGWSVARDVYLYPNIQWVWTDMRPEKTNIALTSYVNL